MSARNVCIALALITATACGGGGGSESTSPPPGNTPPGNTPPPAGAISVTNNSFSPSAKTVAPGTAVEWAWNSCTGGGTDPYGGGGAEVCVAHGVNFSDGTSSPTQDKGTYTRTFNAAGVYNYMCAVHGTAMSGSITVQ
jgi:plastocyanin